MREIDRAIPAVTVPDDCPDSGEQGTRHLDGQSQRYAAGASISETVARLLRAYVLLGKVPDED